MISRVSTAALHRQSTDAMLRHQAELNRLQAQMATGLRISTAADDPVGKQQLLGLDKALGDVALWTENTQLAAERVGLAEDALTSVSNALTRFRELGLQASNATLTAADRQAVAAEMRELYAEVMSLANTRDSQGRYLFAGTDDASAPFSGGFDSPVSYLGNDSVSLLPIGSSRELAVNSSGADIFMRLRTGNGDLQASAAATNSGSGTVKGLELYDSSVWDGGSYQLEFIDAQTYQVLDSTGAVVSSGSYSEEAPIRFLGASITLAGSPQAGDQFSVEPAQASDLFATMERMIDAVSIGDGDAALTAQRNTLIFEAMSALDFAHDALIDQIAGLGSRLAAADDAYYQLQDRSVELSLRQSTLQDLDYTAASTALSQKELALQAAQQSYLKIAGLSLFDYL